MGKLWLRRTQFWGCGFNYDMGLAKKLLNVTKVAGFPSELWIGSFVPLCGLFTYQFPVNDVFIEWLSCNGRCMVVVLAWRQAMDGPWISGLKVGWDRIHPTSLMETWVHDHLCQCYPQHRLCLPWDAIRVTSARLSNLIVYMNSWSFRRFDL